MDTTQADHPKVQDFVEAKGDVVSQVQGQTAITSNQTRALKLEKETFLPIPSAESSATPQKTLDLGPPSAVPKKTILPALENQGPPSAVPKTTLQALANQGPFSSVPKKTILPVLASPGPLTAQPSAPPPAVVSQQLAQVL